MELIDGLGRGRGEQEGAWERVLREDVWDSIRNILLETKTLCERSVARPGSLKPKLKFNFMKLHFIMHKKFNKLYKLNFCPFLYTVNCGNQIKV